MLSHLIKVRDFLNYRDNLSVATFTMSALLIGAASISNLIKSHETPVPTVKISSPSLDENIFLATFETTQRKDDLRHHWNYAYIKYDASNATLRTMAGPYVYDVKRAAAKHHMSSRLIASVVYVETSGKKGIRVSHAGAIGPMQLMPKTAWDKLRINPWNAAQNINGGTEYLAELVGHYHSIKLALIAYNEGPTAVDMGRINEQSVEYADKILALASGASVKQVQNMPS